MWKLLFLPTCFALDWWSMLRMLRETRIEETVSLNTKLYLGEHPYLPELMTDVIPETVTILSLDIQSGTRSPFETVYEYHHRNFYMFNERNSAMFPYRAKTAIILTNEIAGTPTIKTSTSVGTMRVRL